MAEETEQGTKASGIVVAVYPDQDGALEALSQLQAAGYTSDQVSIIGKGVKHTKEIHGWVPHGNEAGHYGKWGAFWGAISGWLLLGFVWLPGIGWVAAGGWLAVTLLGAGIGAGLGALIGFGIPEDELPVYEDAVRADKYLVVVRGDRAAMEHAQDVLQQPGLARVRAYFPPQDEAAQS